ncbi:hypothetical protein MLD38_029453 [Melastoma candidum]|uniref:Uncharacterized protein n=1 Tax=Melastoma candidum TaxID=119954 RepID=A0ACB9N4P2_9MYRT|nr:hypothetical protein MLD38_029453 [Melastoma candidum]
MGCIQLNFCGLSSSSASGKLNFRASGRLDICNPSRTLRFREGKIRAIATVPDGGSESVAPSTEELLSVNFPVLLPDGTPDVHQRVAAGGRKLRNIMLDANIDLYGPYGRPLLNCAGGGTCATCMVGKTRLVVQGSELLSPKTNKEKEKLKRAST